MTISKHTRFEVLRRDGFACRYCGSSAPADFLHVDHVIPRHHGGTDNAWNLTASCSDCNLGKSSGIPDDATIASVRADETSYRSSQPGGRFIIACISCGKPIDTSEDEPPGVPRDCSVCNEIICAAYDAGAGILRRPTLSVVR